MKGDNSKVCCTFVCGFLSGNWRVKQSKCVFVVSLFTGRTSRPAHVTRKHKDTISENIKATKQIVLYCIQQLTIYLLCIVWEIVSTTQSTKRRAAQSWSQNSLHSPVTSVSELCIRVTHRSRKKDNVLNVDAFQECSSHLHCVLFSWGVIAWLRNKLYLRFTSKSTLGLHQHLQLLRFWSDATSPMQAKPQQSYEPIFCYVSVRVSCSRLHILSVLTQRLLQQLKETLTIALFNNNSLNWAVR